MRKIIIIILSLLIFTGCKVENNTTNELVSNEISRNKGSLEDTLKDKEILDMKAVDDKFIAVIGDIQSTNVIVYSLKKESVIAKKQIYDTLLPNATLNILENGYEIKIGNSTSYIFDNNDNFIKQLELPYSTCGLAISQDLKSAAYVVDYQNLYVLNIENNEATKVLTLGNEINELNTIYELAFIDNNTVGYCGGTYLKANEQSGSCYGTININNGGYTKINSSASRISSYKDKVLIHNQSDEYKTNTKNSTFYYDGINGKSLNMTLADSINAIVFASGLGFLESGSDGDIAPSVKINDKIYTEFEVNYNYIIKAEYYKDKLFLYGFIDDKNTVFSVMEV